MKKINLSTTPFLIAVHFLFAPQPDYKVVFDMSTRDPISQQSIMR